MDRFQKLAPNANPSPDNIPAWLMQTFMQASCAVQVSWHYPIHQTYLQLGPHQAPIILQPLQAYSTTNCYCNTSLCMRFNTSYKVYLAAIRLRHIEQGFYDPITDNLLQLVCRGIRRQQGDKQCIRQPYPL